jgi:hypothetical protein
MVHDSRQQQRQTLIFSNPKQVLSSWQAIMGLHLDQLCGRLKKSVVSERLLTSSVLQVEAQKGRLAPYSQSTSRRISTHRKRPVPVAAV